jgi:hypothetical protein
MRPLFKAIIAVFIILIAIAVASQVRGEEKKPVPPQLVIPDTLPKQKLYHPDDSKGTWVQLVNYLMTQDKWVDVNDNEMYHRGFALKNESCTLAYNHSNGILTMTITKVADSDIRMYGKSNVVKVHKSKEITILTMVSIDYDTVPDMSVMQQLDLNEDATKQLGTTVVFNVIPRIKPSPREAQSREFKIQLNHMVEWALWEVHIMETLGFKFIPPVKKEKM